MHVAYNLVYTVAFVLELCTEAHEGALAIQIGGGEARCYHEQEASERLGPSGCSNAITSLDARLNLTRLLILATFLQNLRPVRVLSIATRFRWHRIALEAHLPSRLNRSVDARTTLTPTLTTKRRAKRRLDGGASWTTRAGPTEVFDRRRCVMPRSFPVL
jgi:hypothetical protein